MKRFGRLQVYYLLKLYILRDSDSDSSSLPSLSGGVTGARSGIKQNANTPLSSGRCAGAGFGNMQKSRLGTTNTPRSSGPSAAARSEASTESVSDVRPGLTNTPVSSGRGAGARSGFGCTASCEGKL